MLFTAPRPPLKRQETPPAPPAYLDAAGHAPARPLDHRPAVILVTRNAALDIATRVRAFLRTSAGVVVVDQGSVDGTPYFAAEAGAVVIMQPAVGPCEEAMEQAYRAARVFSTTVRFLA